MIWTGGCKEATWLLIVHGEWSIFHQSYTVTKENLLEIPGLLASFNLDKGFYTAFYGLQFAPVGNTILHVLKTLEAKLRLTSINPTVKFLEKTMFRFLLLITSEFASSILLSLIQGSFFLVSPIWDHMWWAPSILHTSSKTSSIMVGVGGLGVWAPTTLSPLSGLEGRPQIASRLSIDKYVWVAKVFARYSNKKRENEIPNLVENEVTLEPTLLQPSIQFFQQLWDLAVSSECFLGCSKLCVVMAFMRVLLSIVSFPMHFSNFGGRRAIKLRKKMTKELYNEFISFVMFCVKLTLLNFRIQKAGIEKNAFMQ